MHDPNLWDKTVPLGMHCDAGSFSHQNSLYVLSWNSLLGLGSTLNNRFPFTVFAKSDMTDETLQAALHIFGWSMNVLLEGLFPSSDWRDISRRGPVGPLADGWRACLVQCRGDWSYYCEAFGFPQWNSAARMCFVCRASSTIPGSEWFDFRDDTRWRNDTWEHGEYMSYLRLAGITIPALFAIVIGLRLECVCIDTLHTVDLGIASHLAANIMWYYAVCKSVFGGNTQAEKIAHLEAWIKGWYSRNRCPSRIQGKLSVERVR